VSATSRKLGYVALALLAVACVQTLLLIATAKGAEKLDRFVVMPVFGIGVLAAMTGAFILYAMHSDDAGSGSEEEKESPSEK